MDDELLDLERRARERGDAASFLAWAAALRRAGRRMEGATAAFEARARGASREEVFPLGQPQEGSGDACSPWPHPRGDSAGTRRSPVEGPTEKARLLFEIDLRAEDAQWGHGPIVLPDGSIVVALDGEKRGGGRVRCFAPDGAPRWTAGLRDNVSSPIALATGELALTRGWELVFLVAATGREIAHVPMTVHGAGAESYTWSLPIAWNRSVVAGDVAVGADLRISLLRGQDGKRLRSRAAAAFGGSLYVYALAYSVGQAAAGSAPPLIVAPPALHAFGREGELRWVAPIRTETPDVAEMMARSRSAGVAAGAGSVAVLDSELRTFDRASGRLTASRPLAAEHLALDPRDEPIAVARFGPPLLGAPVVDAAGRRYAATRRGDLVGLGPSEEPLFSAALGLEAATFRGLALGPRRLYALVMGSNRRSILCFGDPT